MRNQSLDEIFSAILILGQYILEWSHYKLEFKDSCLKIYFQRVPCEALVSALMPESFLLLVFPKILLAMCDLTGQLFFLY